MKASRLFAYSLVIEHFLSGFKYRIFLLHVSSPPTPSISFQVPIPFLRKPRAPGLKVTAIGPNLNQDQSLIC